MAILRIPFKAEAATPRKDGLGTARGLVNGIIFTAGLWLALMGLVFLVLR